jgi:hypothetical protein
MDENVLAHVAVEVASMLPDDDMKLTRAGYVHKVLALARKIVTEEGVTPDTEDIDEVVVGFLIKEV